jgi:hypothetical protein
MDPRDHIKISDKAIGIYLQHAGGNRNAHFFDDYARTIVFGCWIEDVFPLRERFTRWHFFPENSELKSVGRRKVMGMSLGAVDPTSRVLCHERADQLAKECLRGPRRRFFRLLGRVLHHVQDMSTPPHVVPVYHDPFSRDSYESYSMSNTKERLETVEMSSADFSDLEAQLTGSFELYDEAARATLDYIYERPSSCASVLVNGKVKEVRYDEFWKRCSQHQLGPTVKGGAGFGCYGSLGRHFGQTRFEHTGCKYEVDAAVFKELHADLVQKAVRDSLKVLMFAEAELNART